MKKSIIIYTLILFLQDIDKPDIAWTVKKMFVSGIKEQAEEDLREYFGQYGNILNIQIVADKETGQRKGFGFIEFDDSDSVDKAVCMYNLFIYFHDS